MAPVIESFFNFMGVYRFIWWYPNSCGKKAVPLAVLGAQVSVFDISKDNEKYALELAAAAGVSLDYVVGDVLEMDMEKYGNSFDAVFMEGGISSPTGSAKIFFARSHGLPTSRTQKS